MNLNKVLQYIVWVAFLRIIVLEIMLSMGISIPYRPLCFADTMGPTVRENCSGGSNFISTTRAIHITKAPFRPNWSHYHCVYRGPKLIA